ncbi:cytochrome b [Nitrospirillum viridazoti]|uniref:Cytochrome b561 n=1 Tax=Nitrospirillum amazonense TaxID=28077 RepID=A0A560IZR6_9PROT|nr:cytochrome b [Nitrospirillum amazonense]TWB64396.1 cytochrome b561 [Nitrospirillum amazonense]
MNSAKKYPLAMRLIHWFRAAIVLGMIWLGWKMVSLGDNIPAKFEDFYPLHKSFGLVVIILVAVQLVLRVLVPTPALATGLSKVEAIAAKIAHVALYVLMIVVPVIGYSRSSTFSESDGVTLFGLKVPELLGKNDALSETLSSIHAVLAYTLLAVIVIHVLGALKHRIFDKNKNNDPLSRMI